MTTVDLGASVDELTEAAAPTFLAIFGREPDRAGSLRVAKGREHVSLADDERGTAVVAGELVERDALARLAGRPESGSDAELVLAAYLAHGDEALRRLRGVFALAVHDRRAGTLVFARDHLGHHPLFYAERAGAIYLSETITTLVRHEAVGATVDRAVAAEMLLHRPTSPDETPFAGVYRARSGWRYRADGHGIEASRYWVPIPLDGSVDWATEDELERFDPLMEQAVMRTVAPGATGISLSGGLDSVSVATYAADGLRARGEPPPHAFSLVFPEYDETTVQTIVANSLGLPHLLVPFEEAAGAESLVMSAVRASGQWPVPLVNLWQPLYTHLALRARDAGITRILTGAGGDEWLQVSPHWAFSRLRRLHLGEMQHLYRTYLRSYNLKRWPLLKNLLWKYGLYSTLRELGQAALTTLAPPVAAEIKRRRYVGQRPAWLAPDPELSALLEARASSFEPPANPGVRFVGETRPFLENAVGAMEREEVFERGRRLGMATYMPFWDPDVATFLSRVPPHLMNQGYWSKGLLRTRLARRFPEAGFENQKKVLSTSLSTRLLTSESPGAWTALGGAPTLADAGVVDNRRLQSETEEKLRMLTSPTTESRRALDRAIAAHGIWTVLNVESWLRQWA